MTDQAEGKTVHRIQLQFKTGVNHQATMFTPVESISYLTQLLQELYKAKVAGLAYLIRRSNGDVIGFVDTAEVQMAFIDQATLMADGSQEEPKKNPNLHQLN